MRPRRGARLRRRRRPRLLCGGSVRRGRARLRRGRRRGVAGLRRLLRTRVRRWLGRRSRRFFGNRRFFRWRRRRRRRRWRRWWRRRRRRWRRRRRSGRLGGRVWRRSGRLWRRVGRGRLRIFLCPGRRCEQRESQRGNGDSAAGRESLQTMYTRTHLRTTDFTTTSVTGTFSSPDWVCVVTLLMASSTALPSSILPNAA